MQPGDDAKVQREIRMAAWGGAWRTLGALTCVLLLAAILFPAFTQEHGSGPNKVSPERIAYDIRAYRQAVGAWPTAFDPLRPYLRDILPLHPYRISFLPLEAHGDEARYAIAVDGRVETWRVPVGDRPTRFGEKAAFGTLRP